MPTVEIDPDGGLFETDPLTTAADDVYNLHISNLRVRSTDFVLALVVNGTNSTGTPKVTLSECNENDIHIRVKNTHGVQAFSGTLKIGYKRFRFG